MKYFLTALVLACLSLTTVAETQAPAEIRSLDQLLEKVRQRQRQEAALNRQREAEFIAARDKQKALLRKAEREFLAAQEKNNPMKKITDANASEIKRLQEELASNKQQLGDIYSIYYEFAGDFAAVMQESMIQAQLPQRQQTLDSLTDREQLPTINEMEQLWVLLQEQMTESAKVTTFQAPVLSPQGETVQQQVLRVGTFTAFSNDKFLRFVPETGELLTLSRQPRETRVASDFADNLAAAKSTPRSMIIDPTAGSLLGVLVQTPTLGERIQQGKEVGLAIIAVGLLGLLITLWRGFYLFITWLGTRKQLRNIAKPTANNPLGRVVRAVSGLGKIDEETLQYKLDEAILQEIPKLERGHGLIKLLAAVAPLMGLLGTVVGMIATFQSIAIFGSGDPKLMAGGISQALITTVLGLVVAIPLLFGHNIVSALSRSIVQVLDEQSAGILARHLEKKLKQRSKGSVNAE